MMRQDTVKWNRTKGLQTGSSMVVALVMKRPEPRVDVGTAPPCQNIGEKAKRRKKEGIKLTKGVKQPIRSAMRLRACGSSTSASDNGFPMVKLRSRSSPMSAWLGSNPCRKGVKFRNEREENLGQWDQ